MMSKKDYVALAAALAYADGNNRGSFGLHLPIVRECFEEIVTRVADALAADNPRFSRERFYAACGYDPTEPTR